MSVLDMKPYIEKEIKDLNKDVEYLKEKGINPKFYIITDGEDDRCRTYMKSKLNYGEKVGIDVQVKVVKNISELNLVLLECINEKIPVIMQLPIKKELEQYYNSCEEIKKLDIDGFFSYQKLIERDWDNAPCTPKGVMNFILDSNGLDLDCRKKHLVVAGRGNLCGMPLSIMGMQEFGAVTVLTSKTNKYTKMQALKTADVVVLATGVKGSVKMSELPKDRNIFVMNVGTMFDENGKLTTELDIDCERENVWYTPRIGGIGVLTVLTLLENCITFYINIIKNLKK